MAVSACLAMLAPAGARAQSPRGGATSASTIASAIASAITGSVDDSTGTPVADVTVELLGTRVRIATNAQGRFRVVDLRPGTYRLRARRLGYEPVEFEVQLGVHDTAVVAVELRPASAKAQDLAAVEVRADASPRLTAVGFDNRRRFTGVPASQFVTRVDIEKRNPIVLSQMLRTMTARAQVCANGLVYVDGVKVGTLVETEDAARSDSGTNQTRTSPLTRVMGVGMSFDPTPPPRAKDAMDFVAPSMVEGMEVYVGAAQIPPQYKSAGRANSTSACVILIWTR